MCNFPTRELLRAKRQLAQHADRSHNAEFVRKVTEFVRATDDLRITHHEMTGCMCWGDAAKAEDGEVKAHD